MKFIIKVIYGTNSTKTKTNALRNTFLNFLLFFILFIIFYDFYHFLWYFQWILLYCCSASNEAKTHHSFASRFFLLFLMQTKLIKIRKFDLLWVIKEENLFFVWNCESSARWRKMQGLVVGLLIKLSLDFWSNRKP